MPSPLHRYLYSNRSALGVENEDRAKKLAKGIAGERVDLSTA
jgi:hypothetical protein